MNNLVLNSENLNRILSGDLASRQTILDIFDEARVDPSELFASAEHLRMKFKKNTVTFSKKVFLNVINLCKDTCSYCTYKAEPGESKISLLSNADIKETLHLAKRYRCTEALLVTGERPEQRYPEARTWLARNGFKSTVEYLIHISETALDIGLFPHTNAGNLEYDELHDLSKTNASMGLMLENASERLSKPNMPHHLAASKHPDARIKVLKNAGRLHVPITTGILVGIGETIEEIIDSIITIRDIHKTYGNIQEVIIQNFQPKPDTIMSDVKTPEIQYFKMIVALCRIIMPEMNIQIPPNLSPLSYHTFLKVGINDWGGISPLTPDYVNPEFAWPKISDIDEQTTRAGFELHCRFPTYPEFHRMVHKNIREKMSYIMDKDGLVCEDYWR